MKSQISNLKHFIQNIQTWLPVCDVCNQLKNRYCLETICADKYHCSSCNIPVYLNKHYLHSYITLTYKQLNHMQDQKRQRLRYYEIINGDINQISKICDGVIDHYYSQISRIKYHQKQLQSLQVQIKNKCSLIRQQQVKLQEIFATEGNNFSQKQNQFFKELIKNNLDIHQQIEFSQFIYDQVKQIRNDQIGFDDSFLNEVEQFIARQKQILSSASEYIQVSNDNNVKKQIRYLQTLDGKLSQYQQLGLSNFNYAI